MLATMNETTNLLELNQEWAAALESERLGFFDALAQGQSPHTLWIGCSDSRVPPTQIMKQAPGDLFVHRNIANQVIATDLSGQSVIQYAVQALKVKRVIVCGHYGCGGVIASMSEPSLGLIEGWLDAIREVSAEHADELAGIEDEKAKQDRLCELNVAAQVKNVVASDFVQEAWANGQALAVHGWIFDLGTGRLKDLELTVEGP